MKISNEQNHNYLSPKNNYNKVVSFNGLSKYLSKEVYALPYKKAQQVIACYTKPSLIVGNIPKDILKLIKLPTMTPSVISKNIQIFNTSLCQQAKKIQAFEQQILKQAHNLDIDQLCYDAILQSAQKNNSDRIGFVKTTLNFATNKTKMEEVLNSDNFTKIMKGIGLIPQNGKVQFEFVGAGTYKNCFKLNFLDKNNNAIIHPKAFLVYKLPNLGCDCDKIIKSNLATYMQNTNFDTFQAKMLQRINQDKSLTPEIQKSAISEIKKFFDGKYKTLYTYNGASVFEDFNDINGVFPEANVALKIKKDLGKDIDKSNIITPYLFDLKNKFGLVEFADNNLEPAKINYDFKKHHLCWIDDRADNYATQGGKKIIDLGCIFPDSKNYCD